MWDTPRTKNTVHPRLLADCMEHRCVSVLVSGSPVRLAWVKLISWHFFNNMPGSTQEYIGTLDVGTKRFKQFVLLIILFTKNAFLFLNPSTKSCTFYGSDTT